ncbi:MAG: lipid-A-disaccharide synthase [Desulfobacterota bacterium]|nr:lipid-A-disaccharide synthase [Thermodesulfobacteriota bacterium]
MEKTASKKILIIAGETSGDLHGANLVKEQVSLKPHLRFYRLVREKVKNVGVELIGNITEIAVVGIAEVFFKLKKIYQIYYQLKKLLIKSKPDLVILIDYPDFNLLFARKVKRKNIPIIYYISPQVWAWRRSRVKKISQLVKKMIVIFPFEKSFYQEKGMEVEFVGHPLLDSIPTQFSREKIWDKFSLTPGITTIGLLPGSRRTEIQRNFPPMIKAIPLITKKISPVQFIIPVAPGIEPAEFQHFIDYPFKNLHIIKNNIYEVMKIADLLIVASGTATVEAAIIGTPMIIVYRVSPLTYFLGKKLIKVKNIGMVNIIAGKAIVPELIQKDLTPENIARLALEILGDPQRLAEMKVELSRVREKLGEPGASFRAANIINQFLNLIEQN